jgi:hypothetical protein
MRRRSSPGRRRLRRNPDTGSRPSRSRPPGKRSTRRRTSPRGRIPPAERDTRSRPSRCDRPGRRSRCRRTAPRDRSLPWTRDTRSRSRKPFDGHPACVPSQLSATSQIPAEARHSPPVTKPSAGQAAAVPVQLRRRRKPPPGRGTRSRPRRSHPPDRRWTSRRTSPRRRSLRGRAADRPGGGDLIGGTADRHAVARLRDVTAARRSAALGARRGANVRRARGGGAVADLRLIAGPRRGMAFETDREGVGGGRRPKRRCSSRRRRRFPPGRDTRSRPRRRRRRDRPPRRRRTARRRRRIPPRRGTRRPPPAPRPADTPSDTPRRSRRCRTLRRRPADRSGGGDRVRGGRRFDVPSQISCRIAAARRGVTLDAHGERVGGHAACVPSQVSATSQIPAAERPLPSQGEAVRRTERTDAVAWSPRRRRSRRRNGTRARRGPASAWCNSRRDRRGRTRPSRTRRRLGTARGR